MKKDNSKVLGSKPTWRTRENERKRQKRADAAARRERDRKRKQQERSDANSADAAARRERDRKRKQQERADANSADAAARRECDKERKRGLRLSVSTTQESIHLEMRRRKYQAKRNEQKRVLPFDEHTIAKAISPRNQWGQHAALFETPAPAAAIVDCMLGVAARPEISLCDAMVPKVAACAALQWVHGIDGAPSVALWLPPKNATYIATHACGRYPPWLKELAVNLQKLSVELPDWCQVSSKPTALIYPTPQELDNLARQFPHINIGKGQQQVWHLDAALNQAGLGNYVWASESSEWTQVCCVGERGTLKLLYDAVHSGDGTKFVLDAIDKVGTVEFPQHPKAVGGIIGLAFSGLNFHRGSGNDSSGRRVAIFCAGRGFAAKLSPSGTPAAKRWVGKHDADAVVTIANAIEMVRELGGGESTLVNSRWNKRVRQI